MERNKNKSDTPKWWCWRCWKLSPDLLFAYAVQTVYEALTKQWIIWRHTKWLTKKCREWGVKMWVAAIDFMKAFDTHKLIWDALESCGIEFGYINLLKKLYKNQKANVMTDEESDVFQIKKGTCPACSSTLFCKRLWRTTSLTGKRREEWVFALVTKTMAASRICDLRTTCSYWLHQKNSSKKWCATSNAAQKKWVSNYIRRRRKFSESKFEQ